MPSAGSSVLFQVPARAIARGLLRQFARKLEEEVALGRPFCCLVTRDAELRRLNREFRKKDHATDVLSFPADGAPGGLVPDQSAILGEIAISYDRAQQQAAELAHGLEQELQILMLHGVLHLTGMDHEGDRGEMKRAEKRWRKHFGLPPGLIERVRS